MSNCLYVHTVNKLKSLAANRGKPSAVWEIVSSSSFRCRFAGFDINEQ